VLRQIIPPYRAKKSRPTLTVSFIYCWRKSHIVCFSTIRRGFLLYTGTKVRTETIIRFVKEAFPYKGSLVRPNLVPVTNSREKMKSRRMSNCERPRGLLVVCRVCRMGSEAIVGRTQTTFVVHVRYRFSDFVEGTCSTKHWS
jgi:hypothetical protein